MRTDEWERESGGARAGAGGLAVVGGAAVLAAALVFLALVDGQADACRGVPTQLHRAQYISVTSPSCFVHEQGMTSLMS